MNSLPVPQAAVATAAFAALSLVGFFFGPPKEPNTKKQGNGFRLENADEAEQMALGGLGMGMGDTMGSNPLGMSSSGMGMRGFIDNDGSGDGSSEGEIELQQGESRDNSAMKEIQSFLSAAVQLHNSGQFAYCIKILCSCIENAPTIGMPEPAQRKLHKGPPFSRLSSDITRITLTVAEKIAEASALEHKQLLCEQFIRIAEEHLQTRHFTEAMLILFTVLHICIDLEEFSARFANYAVTMLNAIMTQVETHRKLVFNRYISIVENSLTKDHLRYALVILFHAKNLGLIIGENSPELKRAEDLFQKIISASESNPEALTFIFDICIGQVHELVQDEKLKEAERVGVETLNLAIKIGEKSSQRAKIQLLLGTIAEYHKEFVKAYDLFLGSHNCFMEQKDIGSAVVLTRYLATNLSNRIANSFKKTTTTTTTNTTTSTTTTTSTPSTTLLSADTLTTDQITKALSEAGGNVISNISTSENSNESSYTDEELQKYYNEIISWSEKAISIASEMPTTSKSGKVTLLFNAAEACADAGKFAKGVEYCREAISITDDAIEDKWTAVKLITEFLKEQGKAKEAYGEIEKYKETLRNELQKHQQENKEKDEGKVIAQVDQNKAEPNDSNKQEVTKENTKQENNTQLSLAPPAQQESQLQLTKAQEPEQILTEDQIKQKKLLEQQRRRKFALRFEYFYSQAIDYQLDLLYSQDMFEECDECLLEATQYLVTNKMNVSPQIIVNLASCYWELKDDAGARSFIEELKQVPQENLPSPLSLMRVTYRSKNLITSKAFAERVDSGKSVKFVFDISVALLLGNRQEDQFLKYKKTRKRRIEGDFFVEIHFENTDPEKPPILMTQTVSTPEFTVISPTLAIPSPKKFYEVTLKIFRDKSKQEFLGFHHQLMYIGTNHQNGLLKSAISAGAF